MTESSTTKPPITLPYKWRPREYQRALWEYLAKGGKNAVMIAHRRAGKDAIALHHTACAAHERVGSYLHCLPHYSQSRKALWDQVSPHTGMRRIDEAFPHELRASTREDEMFIKFKNGSTWQLAGSDSYNSLVGTSYAGIVHSEYALADPAAQGYFAPILMENNGWQLFITTPRGKNHAHSMYNYAKRQMQAGKDWYAELAPASKTGALDAQMLIAERDRLQELHGDEYGYAIFSQEYECSFDAAIPGSIFGDVLRTAEAAGRLGEVPVDAGLPVFTGWDLGRTDDTAIWWAQVFAGELRVIAYHASSGKDVPFYVDILDEMRGSLSARASAAAGHRVEVNYGVNWLPHDARPRTLASPRSILQQFDEANKSMGGRLGSFGIAPRLDKQEQIQAGRATLKQSWIDSTHCEKGIEALRHYHREWDDEKKVFKDSPEHDWSSHPSDAWLSLSVAWRKGRIPRGEKTANTNTGDSSTLGAGVTFGERKKVHLRKRRQERLGMFA